MAKGPAFSSGAEAIQALVDTRAQLKALRAWQAELAEWQRQMGVEEHKLGTRQKEAIDFITTLAQDDPASLGLTVSEEACARIKTGEASMDEAALRTDEYLGIPDEELKARMLA